MRRRLGGRPPEARRKLANLIGTGDDLRASRAGPLQADHCALPSGWQDFGAAMVSAGMAYAFTRYSSEYVDQERAAIGARLGVYAHDCEKPWDWRARSEGADETQLPVRTCASTVVILRKERDYGPTKSHRRWVVS